MGSFIWKTVRLYGTLSVFCSEFSLTTFNRQIGNTWVMFFAGHETTASVLAATFCFLAGYQREQDIVFEELRSIAKGTVDGQLGFDQYDSLFKTRSAFVEALRMFPAGALLLRETREDTILHVPAGIDEHGSVIEESIPVPKGTVIAGDMIGMRACFARPRRLLYSPLISQNTILVSFPIPRCIGLLDGTMLPRTTHSPPSLSALASV